jgi:hypothetical protein
MGKNRLPRRPPTRQARAVVARPFSIRCLARARLPSLRVSFSALLQSTRALAPGIRFAQAGICGATFVRRPRYAGQRPLYREGSRALQARRLLPLDIFRTFCRGALE